MTQPNTNESLAAIAVQRSMADVTRHNELKAQNERIINGQMISQQLLRELIEEQQKTNLLLTRILAAT